MKSMTKMRKNEQGMVSILVTMIMIIVITLIVLGFAQVTRRNQREALDNQLSTQAYYAAESGVNSAVNYLTQPANAGAKIDTVGDCTQFLKAPYDSTAVNVLDSGTNTKYTCLMVNTDPNTLTLAPLTQNSNQILYLANTDNQAFTQLSFSWGAETGSSFSTTNCTKTGSAGTTFPSYSNWGCAYGILRLDLVDANNISSTAFDNNQGTMSFYLVPSTNSGTAFKSMSSPASINWAPAVQPVDPSKTSPACSASSNNCPVQVIPVSCNASGCAVKLNITGGSTKYFARLSMMYQDSSNVVIAGGDSTTSIGASGTGVSFTGGQAMIDSTGQSGDELRRIQVRIPLTAANSVTPAYGLQTTQSICKQIQDSPSIYTDNCPGHP